MADFYAARAGTNAGAPLDGFLTALHTRSDAKFVEAELDAAHAAKDMWGRTSPAERSVLRNRIALVM